MKVTLDLDQLLADGQITKAEYDRLAAFSSQGTASMAFSIMLGIGIVAVSLGLIALVPDAVTGIVVGCVMLGGGLFTQMRYPGRWDIVSYIVVLVGALALAGGLIFIAEASTAVFLGITIGFALVGILARSGLLIVLAVLAFSSAFGARTEYMHASYALGMEQPTITIILFSFLALGTYLLSLRLPHDYARLAILAARTSLFLVNFGFWIATLWGDRFNPETLSTGASVGAEFIKIGPMPYIILWAVALIATGVWAVVADRRWVVTVVAVFGMIHLYTQWFERFGANPVSVLVAGLLTLGLAIGLWNFNRGLWGKGAAAGT